MIFNFWDHIEAEILVRNDDNPNEYKWEKLNTQPNPNIIRSREVVDGKVIYIEIEKLEK